MPKDSLVLWCSQEIPPPPTPSCPDPPKKYFCSHFIEYDILLLLLLLPLFFTFLQPVRHILCMAPKRNLLMLVAGLFALHLSPID